MQYIAGITGAIELFKKGKKVADMIKNATEKKKLESLPFIHDSDEVLPIIYEAGQDDRIPIGFRMMLQSFVVQLFDYSQYSPAVVDYVITFCDQLKEKALTIKAKIESIER